MSPRLSLNGEEGTQAVDLWENDDMTLDMLTDVNEDEVDEEVRMSFYARPDPFILSV